MTAARSKDSKDSKGAETKPDAETTQPATDPPAADAAAAPGTEGAASPKAEEPVDARPAGPVEKTDAEQEAEYIASASDRDVELAKKILRAKGIEVIDDEEPEGEGVPAEPPAAIANMPGAEILMEACAIYGINPDQELIPRELLAWKFYPADRDLDLPASIRLVTAGGVKLRHYEDGLIDERRDPDTALILRAKLRLFRMDPATRQMVGLPLPSDLTLPDEAVTGQVLQDTHQFKGGYLRSGGRAEAARREQSAPGDVFRPSMRRRSGSGGSSRRPAR